MDEPNPNRAPNPNPNRNSNPHPNRGALWMSILRGRSVYDGAFVSMDPADPRVGPTSAPYL